jgi:membrane-bound metal-dependent hydrolase YbcI (DUF457 family)
MMGRHHALLGAVIWTGPAIEIMGRTHLGEIVASTAVCGAAAMLPDIDEPGSTVAHVLEPFSGMVSQLTNELCGGHRKASHSLIAVALFGGMGWGLSLNPIATAVGFGVLILLAFRAFAPIGFRHGLIATSVAAASGFAVAYGKLDVAWFPLALMVGYAIHLLGDILTSGGVPLFWPWKKRIALPILSHTNSGREMVFSIFLWVVLVGIVFVSGVWKDVHIGQITHQVDHTVGHVKGLVTHQVHHSVGHVTSVISKGENHG